MSGCGEKGARGRRQGRCVEADEQGGFGRALRAEKMRLPALWKSLCDKASDHARVMLHLRACHASKAAILTIFAGRKSKSRLNSKGLDR